MAKSLLARRHARAVGEIDEVFLAKLEVLRRGLTHAAKLDPAGGRCLEESRVLTASRSTIYRVEFHRADDTAIRPFGSLDGLDPEFRSGHQTARIRVSVWIHGFCWGCDRSNYPGCGPRALARVAAACRRPGRRCPEALVSAAHALRNRGPRGLSFWGFIEFKMLPLRLRPIP